MLPKIANVLAQVVAVLHLLWAVAIGGGAVLVWWYPGYAPILAGLAGWTLIHQATAPRCALTVWEERLRKYADPAWRFPEGGFLASYWEQLFPVRIPKWLADVATKITLVIALISAVVVWLTT